MSTSNDKVSRAFLGGLFLIAAGAAIYVLKPVLLPVTLAGLLGLILKPVYRGLRRIRLPALVAAGLILAALLGLTGAAVGVLASPAMLWIERLPLDTHQMEDKLRGLRQPFDKLRRAAMRMDDMAATADPDAPIRVDVTEPTVGERAMGVAGNVLVYGALTFILLFMMLGYGEAVVQKLRHRPSVAATAQEVGTLVSRYLATITLINMVLGMTIAVAMRLLGLPNPLLWGMMGGLLNFVPYLGAIVGTGVVFLVALLSFDSVGHILLVPVCFYALTALEGSFITPMILGNRFKINPLFMLVWLMFWGLVWGITGALIAVPLLMALKIICEHVPALAEFGEVISL